MPPPLLNAFLHDDAVEAEVTVAADGRATATAITLLKRPRRELCGRVGRRNGKVVLRVDRAVANTDWDLEGAADIADGTHVIANIKAGAGNTSTYVRSVAADEVAVVYLLVRYMIPVSTAAAVEAAATALPPLSTSMDAELKRRRDLRDMVLVTIDGPSTKDIDDAVGCFAVDDDGALRVIVAIADVSAFVEKGDVIDDDARARATTVYLPDLVLPMLPRSLSEDRLSLVEGEDRLVMVCELRIDVDGVVRAADVHEAVMRSTARLTYDAVAAFLDEGDETAVKDVVKATLRRLRAASARLGVQRAARGGVAVDRSEAQVHFDDKGQPVAVSQTVSTSAHLLIERLMVAANEAVARWCFDRALPTLYRVHHAPDVDKTAALADAAAALGIEAGFSRRAALSPLGLAAFDAQLQGLSIEPAARLLLRRLLGPAVYTPEPVQHFGLAAPLYLHFTSPIRRYADLVVHRLLKQFLHGDRDVAAMSEGLVALAAHIDGAAKRASRAEDERSRTLVAATFERRIGESLTGRVIGHKPFGALIQLPGIVATLPGADVVLGAAVDVRVVAVDVDLGRVEVSLNA